jgi:hypothetical protein
VTWQPAGREDGLAAASAAGAPARRTFDLPGGAQAEALPAGPPEGLPLVLHNGTPGGPVIWPGTI